MDITRCNIRIFDQDINFLGEIDNYDSLMFHRRHKTFNQFEFHVSEYNAVLFKKYNVIMLDNDPYRTGIILQIEDLEKDSQEVIVKGFCMRYFLRDRITIPDVGTEYDTYNTEIENIMLSLMHKNVVHASNASRKIPYLECAQSQNRGQKFNFQTRYKVLSEELESLLEVSALGAIVKLDAKNKRWIFEVYQGNDRSYNNVVDNPPIIFAKEYDNVLERDVTDSDVGYKNMAYVAGQGEGVDREIITVHNELTGLNRHELYVDARDIGSDGDTTLADRGKIKLADYQSVYSVEVTVDPRDYRIQWDLGDFITFKDKKTNTMEHKQVVEIQETFENGIVKIEPIFGESLKTITEVMRRNNKNITSSTVSGGGNDKAFTYYQSTPQDKWIIEHHMNKYPNITIMDSSNSVVVGNISYLDKNTVNITFSSGFSGTAYLN